MEKSGPDFMHFLVPSLSQMSLFSVASILTVYKYANAEVKQKKSVNIPSRTEHILCTSRIHLQKLLARIKSTSHQKYACCINKRTVETTMNK
jgi:hypothetical protein